jgi:hypothetical protein
MSGWPQKITRAALGPIYENASKVTNPKKNLDAGILNLLAWQVAGLNGTAPRGLVRCTLSGTVVTVTHQWFAWDPDGALAKMAWTRSSTGVFTWTLPGTGSYADANGISVPAGLIGCSPIYQGTANNQLVADVNVDGISGTMNAYDADAGGAVDPAKWLAYFV